LRFEIDHYNLAVMAAKTDLFICHASDDKEAFVRPLAVGLRSLGVSVWYDEFSLQPGDSLSRSIDKGIAGSKNAVVVISSAFVAKAWPEHELRGLVAREIAGEVRIIPIWHGVTHSGRISP
jgi:TIR domain